MRQALSEPTRRKLVLSRAKNSRIAGWVEGWVSSELWASESRVSSELRVGLKVNFCAVGLENVAPAVGGGRLQM